MGKWKHLEYERQKEGEALGMPWHQLTGLGIVLGPVGNVHAFDVDKATMEEARKFLQIMEFPENYPWIVQSGSGEGFHIYFKSNDLLTEFENHHVLVITNSPEIKCKQIELRICGLIVAPGSKHKSGKQYEFINKNNFEKEMIFIDASRVKELIKKLAGVEHDASTEAAPENTEQETQPHAFDKITFDKVSTRIQLLKAQPETERSTIADDYSTWSRIGLGLSFEFGEGGRQLFHDFSQVSTKYVKEECDKAFDGFIKAQQQSKKRPVKIGTVFYLFNEAGIIPKESTEDELKPEEGNQYYATIKIINQRYKITRDVFTDTVYVDGKILDERHLNNMVILLQSKFGFSRISKDYLLSYLSSDYVPTFHRIHQLLQNHKPINPTGNIQKLADTLITETGAGITVTWRGEKRPFKDVIIEIFYMKMITQFERPDPNDVCLVPLGDMALGKTYWLTNLLPKELNDLCRITQFTNDKDFRVQLVESALLVIDEIREKDMSSNEFMKMVMTMPSMHLRPVYTMLPRPRRRIATLCGTGNNRFILRDISGNRRFVPLWLTEIDRLTFNSINKIDLLAEGYNLFRSGYPTELTRELISVIAHISKDFELKTEADELMLFHCPPCKANDIHGSLMSVSELCDLLFERTKKRVTFSQVGMAVARMGYESKVVGVKTHSGKVSKVWKYYCKPTIGDDDEFNQLPDLPTLYKAPTPTTVYFDPLLDQYPGFFD